MRGCRLKVEHKEEEAVWGCNERMQTEGGTQGGGGDVAM